MERNVIPAVVATALSPFIEGWQYLIVWLILACTLILGDLRFGIMAARKRGEKIRSSRAIRRTINKLVDYLCWVSIAMVMGGTFGNIFGVPVLAAIIMVIVCAVELSSIFDNYFEYRGLKKKFNVWKFFSKIFHIPEIADSIEEAPKE